MSAIKETSEFWRGDFGDEYVERHDEARMLPAKRFMFRRMLREAKDIGSVMELGTNQGLNLKVLHELLPDAELSGVEINEKAATLASGLNGVQSVITGSLLDVEPDRQYDLAFTAGVLIHIAPEDLPRAYENLVRFSGKYVLIAEYHNTSPREIPYRGHRNKMYMRDFAGEILDSSPGLRLVDYGFFYKRDSRYGLGDLNWFLMEKMSSE